MRPVVCVRAVLAAVLAAIVALPQVRHHVGVQYVRLKMRVQGDLLFAAPDAPRARSELDAPGAVPCTAVKRVRASRNCGGRCDVVLVGAAVTEALTGSYCYWAISGTSQCGPTYCALAEDEAGRAFRQAFPFHNRTLVLAGAGDQTFHTLAMLDEVLPVLKAPKVYSVLVGTDNLGFAGQGPSEPAFRGIRAVVQRLRAAHPESWVLLHALHPRYDDLANGIPVPPGPWNDRVGEVNEMLRRFAGSERERVVFVDCNHVFLDPSLGGSLQHVMPDYLHLNGEGYRRWFACWRPTLERAMANAS